MVGSQLAVLIPVLTPVTTGVTPVRFVVVTATAVQTTALDAVIAPAV